MNKSKQSYLLDAIGTWIKKLDSYPGFRDWQREKVAATLSLLEGAPLHDDSLPSEFKFTNDLDRQHAAILSYLSLASSFYSLDQCQYYFRRFPFADLPVSKEDHIRNMCEMYFNRFYEFRERLKLCLNSIDKSIGPSINTGAIIKKFSKDFDQEIRARNSIHHQERFDDASINGIGLATLMSRSDKVGPGWGDVASRGYRRSSAEWAARAKRRSQVVETYVEAVAGAMLDMCPYLKDSSVGHGSENPVST